MDPAALTIWERCRPYIEAAVAAGEPDMDTIEDIEARVRAGTAHLWPGENCAGVTEYIPGPALHIWAAGGSLRGLLAMRESVEAFAWASDCQWIELDGRAGWTRLFSRFGYQADGTRMFKRHG